MIVSSVAFEKLKRPGAGLVIDQLMAPDVFCFTEATSNAGGDCAYENAETASNTEIAKISEKTRFCLLCDLCDLCVETRLMLSYFPKLTCTFIFVSIGWPSRCVGRNSH
jgi:hypothetical protein